jgi:hypothetical protein
VLLGAPGELSGESLTIMSRVDDESLRSSFFLGGVPDKKVCEIRSYFDYLNLYSTGYGNIG